MIVSIRMTEEEKKIAVAYAKLNGVSLSEAIKRAFFKEVEDYYDLALADKAMEEYKKDSKTYTLEEIEKEFGLI